MRDDYRTIGMLGIVGQVAAQVIAQDLARIRARDELVQSSTSPTESIYNSNLPEEPHHSRQVRRRMAREARKGTLHARQQRPHYT